MIKKVEVIQEFPGYAVGDQLELNPGGTFAFIGNVEDADKDAFTIIEAVMTYNKPAIYKRYVMDHMNSYFKDVTDYSMRSTEELYKRINELKLWLSTYKDDGTAQTVWQNLVWELEWVLGKRNIGETK